MPLHVSSTRAHHQEVKIILHSLWYHHTYTWPSRARVMQFWPPDDEHMWSKHVEARNKLIVKQKFCASSWLNTEINILRCTVSKTSKFTYIVMLLYTCVTTNLLNLLIRIYVYHDLILHLIASIKCHITYLLLVFLCKV